MTKILENRPFDRDTFQAAFNGYVRTLGVLLFVPLLLLALPFIAYGIARYLEMTKVDITNFLAVWHASENFLRDVGLPDLTYKAFASGVVSFGGISFGVISVGLQGSCGVIAIGGFGSCGIIAISPMFSVGVVSLGGMNAYGIIALATGSKNPFEDGYVYGKAFGVVAIGRCACGVYALSYGTEGTGSYQLSPARQDPEAVTLFTGRLRKFKGAFTAAS